MVKKIIILFIIFIILLFSCDRYEFIPYDQWETDEKDDDGDGGSKNNAVYVSTVINSGGTGLLPTDTTSDINNAINIALANARNRVNITGENYNVGYINLASGISIYGGYSSDFSTRDPFNNKTVINYTNSNYGIVALGINNVTVDGFDLNPIGDKSTGFNCSDSNNITISNNIINSDSSNMVNKSIYLFDSGIIYIRNNYISSYTANTESYCIHIISQTTSSDTKIINNVIVNGYSTGYSYGIVASIYVNSIVDIYNNTIDTRNAGTARYGVFFENQSGNTYSNVKNNLFVSNDQTISYGLNKMSTNDNVYLEDYNNAYITLQHYNYLGGSNISSINNVILSGTTDYLSVLDYNSGDYHLYNLATISSLLGPPTANSILYGGIDGNAAGWGYSYDKDGNPRNAGWSIGAYEQNN